MSTVASWLLTQLESLGTSVIFGYPGGAVLPLYDALVDSSLTHVSLPHEQDVGHAAEGYAIATRRMGVVIATSGPGATNIMTPLASATANGTSLLAITGQVTVSTIGTMAFQEAPIADIAGPATKYSTLVRHESEIPDALRTCIRAATEPRAGGALLDIPKDILARPADDLPRSPNLGSIHFTRAHPSPGHAPATPAGCVHLERVTRELARLNTSAMIVSTQVVQSGSDRTVSPTAFSAPGWAIPAALGFCLGSAQPTWAVVRGSEFAPMAKTLLGSNQMRIPVNVALVHGDEACVDLRLLGAGLGFSYEQCRMGQLDRFASRERNDHTPHVLEIIGDDGSR